MAKKKVRRSETKFQRKLIFIWLIAIFFLVLLVLLSSVIIYNQVNESKYAVIGEIDYSKIHFEGLSVGKEASKEILKNPIVDAEYDYSWHNISIAVDDNNIITKLGFYTTAPSESDMASDGINIHNTDIDYRNYPLQSFADFVNYFGTTKITNFNHFKYLTYQDERYVVDVTLYDGEVYNIELTQK